MRYSWIICLVFVLFCSCDSTSIKIRNVSRGSALGTSYNVIYLTHQELDLQNKIDSVFTVINSSLSTYIPDSDISRINAGDSTQIVDIMFKEVFELSKEVYTATNGYFDPTVGTLVNAWGFGPKEGIKMDSILVDSLLNFVGFDKVRITENNTIEKKSKELFLDFNAVAKGYAIDRLALMLDKQGIQNYLIEVGGELVAKGSNVLKQKSWVVGIDDPQVNDGRESKILIDLTNRGMASSGNYRKFRIDEITGTKYVHTIDPRTGFTKNSNTLAVTILANNCATADAYATAFMAMDLDDAFKLIVSKRDLEAYIIYLDENGETQEFMTEGFEALVIKPSN